MRFRTKVDVVYPHVGLTLHLEPQVLKHLTIKRPLTVNRMDFFAQVRS